MIKLKCRFHIYQKKNDEPWYGEHKSNRYGHGYLSLYDIKNGSEATPEDIALGFCKKLKIKKPFKIQNIQSNYIDLYIPEFIKKSLVSPNYPEQSPEISRVLGYVMFADLRGFSNWALSVEPEQVSEVYDVLSGSVVQMMKDYPYSYWKLLGDGIMLVWEVDQDEDVAVDNAIGAAYELHKKYWYFRKESVSQVPEGFGIAITGGHFTKYESSTFFE